MANKFLLTGRPGCGKTTLIKRVLNELTLPAGGFYTQEIRKGSQRVGFKLVTLEGQEALLAHVDFETPQRVGRYGVDLSALDTIGAEAIRAAVCKRQIVVIDEIGPMEIRSATFCNVVTEALDSRAPIFATITGRSLPFTDAIKKRSDLIIITVRPNNRDQLVFELSEQFTA
jgi:nucleoside-triphosphatase